MVTILYLTVGAKEHSVVRSHWHAPRGALPPPYQWRRLFLPTRPRPCTPFPDACDGRRCNRSAWLAPADRKHHRACAACSPRSTIAPSTPIFSRNRNIEGRSTSDVGQSRQNIAQISEIPDLPDLPRISARSGCARVAPTAGLIRPCADRSVPSAPCMHADHSSS